LGKWLTELTDFSGDVSERGGSSVEPTESELAAVLRGLEDLKNAAAAAQAQAARRLDTTTRSREAAAGVRPFRSGRGVASELGFARRISPHRARGLLGLAKVLPDELPATWSAFRQGRASEPIAIAMAKATACLSLEHRLQVDRELAGDPAALEQMSLKEVEAAAARRAAQLDPGSVAKRRRIAEGERRVTISPAPDTMSRLTVLVPLTQGVAAFAALKKHADQVHGTDAAAGRARGQLMADRAVELLTGQARAERTPVRVNLVMTDTGLLGDDESTALLVAKGLGRLELPAQAARRLVAGNLADEATGGAATWLRRLYRHPASGQLLGMDATTRKVPPGLAEFITLRDQTCRNAWCDAPVRHIDHVEPVEEGGPTSADNLQGLCEACNHAKQAPGWRQVVHTEADGTHVVETVTPAGRRYRSRPPDPGGRPPSGRLAGVGSATDERRRLLRIV